MKSYYDKIIEGASWLSNKLVHIRYERLESLKNRVQNALIENTFVSAYRDRFYLASIILCIGLFISLHGFFFYFSYSLIPTYKDQYQCTICNDGHISYSHNQGACSWHDGVARYVYRKVEDSNKQIFTSEYGVSLLIFFALFAGLSVYTKASSEITFHTLNWFALTYILLLLWCVYYSIIFILIFLMPIFLVAFGAYYFIKIFIWNEVVERVLKKI